MPTRLLNYAMVACVPLVVGALMQRRDDPLARATFLALGVIAVLWYRAHGLSTFGLPLVGVATLAVVARGARPGATGPLAPAWRIAERVAAVGVVVGVIVALAIAARGYPNRVAKLRDYTNDPVLAAASQGEGLLLVAPGIPFPQLTTRRPVLLDPNAIDMLPYAPEGAPAVARIVTEVYGIDFFDPPAQARNRAVVEPAAVAPVWRSRDADPWPAIARSNGFHDAIVPSSWVMALRPTARGDQLVLYEVLPRLPFPGPPGSQ